MATTCADATVRFAAELGYEVTVVKDAIADLSHERMHAALAINIPHYATAIVTTMKSSRRFHTGRIQMRQFSKNDEAIRKLSPEQYRVTQQNGTEAPGTGEYLNNNEPGIYVLGSGRGRRDAAELR